MGKMTITMPDDFLKKLDKMANSHQTIEKLVEAGQEVLYENIKANLPQSLKENNFRNCVKKTRNYYTSDGATNAGVVITGYFTNEKGKQTPAPLVANMFEYGSNIHHFPKQPFVRKSMKKKQIINAMEKAYEEAIDE